MERLQVAIRPLRRAHQAHQEAHRREAVQMPGLRAVLLALRSPVAAHEETRQGPRRAMIYFFDKGDKMWSWIFYIMPIKCWHVVHPVLEFSKSNPEVQNGPSLWSWGAPASIKLRYNSQVHQSKKSLENIWSIIWHCKLELWYKNLNHSFAVDYFSSRKLRCDTRNSRSGYTSTKISESYILYSSNWSIMTDSSPMMCLTLDPSFFNRWEIFAAAGVCCFIYINLVYIF